jgi:EF hand
MKKIATLSIIALSMAVAGAASAQTAAPAPSAPAATPSAPATAPAVKAAPAAPAAAATTTAPAVTMDAATEAKFKAADKGGKGMIEGAALEPFKSVMAQVDTDKDGKISRGEFAAATKAGIIK